MENIFSVFSNLLEKRFKEGVVTTEDSIRYTFFASLLSEGIKPHEVILEYPHPTISRAQIDTWLPNINNEAVAIEFKYDRDPPGGMNQPKTQKAGSIFRDIHRQVQVARNEGVNSYFIYVTSEEMANYFRNPNNGHTDFFNLLQGHEYKINESYFSNRPMTFTKTLGGSFSANIISVLSQSLPNGNYLRIYKVC